MRKDLKQSLISTSFYLLILTTFLPLPLAAMNDGEGRESVTRVLSRSIAKAGVGATLIWTGMQLEEYNASYSSQFPERDYHNGILLAEQMSTIVGLKLIASACYDLGLYAYTSWKLPSIRAQIETDAKGAKKIGANNEFKCLKNKILKKKLLALLITLLMGWILRLPFCGFHKPSIQYKHIIGQGTTIYILFILELIWFFNLTPILMFGLRVRAL